MAKNTFINKSRVFKRAWELYRFIHNSYAPWQIDRGFVDGSFSHALKAAWAEEKRLVNNAQGRAVHGVEIKALEARKVALQYKPFGHSIASEVAAIDSQINQLIAA